MDSTNKNITSNNRLQKINNLRVLAIILVVFIHSIIIYSSSWNLYETSNKVVLLDYLEKIIYIVPMPLFFSISGYLFFFSQQKYLTFREFFIKKFKRLIIPFFCVGLFYLLPIRKLIGYQGYLNKSFFEILIKNFFLSSDIGHLWYLPTLFFLFIISELILLIVKKISYIYEKVEIVFMVIAFILYFVGYRIAFSYPPLMSAYLYFIWFTLGFFLNKRKSIFNPIYNNKILKIILVLINIIGLIYYGLADNTSVIFDLGVRALTIINLFKLIPNTTNKLLDKLGENSFGIYLFHSPLVYITFSYIPNINPIILIFLNFIIFGGIAWAISILIRKTKLRFVIGE